MRTLQVQWDENIDGDFQNPLDYVACFVFSMTNDILERQCLHAIALILFFISVVFVATNCPQTTVFMPATRWCCLASVDILTRLCVCQLILVIPNCTKSILCTWQFAAFFGSFLVWKLFMSLKHLCELVLTKPYCNIIFHFQNFVDCGGQTMLTVL